MYLILRKTRNVLLCTNLLVWITSYVIPTFYQKQISRTSLNRKTNIYAIAYATKRSLLSTQECKNSKHRNAPYVCVIQVFVQILKLFPKGCRGHNEHFNHFISSLKQIMVNTGFLIKHNIYWLHFPFFHWMSISLEGKPNFLLSATSPTLQNVP